MMPDMTDDRDIATEETLLIAEVTTPMSIPIAPSPTLGDRVVAGRYEIRSLIGQGGMGNVYRVFDRELEEIVALKTLHDELAQRESAIARFRAEVRLARRVTHRNVARTFDIGTERGMPFLTMEFIEGRSLARLLETRQRLNVPAVLELVADIALGLDAAHEAGVVHQDLKPANILIEDDTERVVISDFGIARARDASVSDRGFAGTPAYMSPEQLTAPETLDGRADLYALGVMMFEMLTGALPFRGSTPMATAMARMLEDVPDLSSHVEIPEVVASIVTRCLARDRAQRYPSAAALHDAVKALSGAASALSHSTVRRIGSASDDGRTKSVAVLPLRAMGSGGSDHLREGLTEELIDELSMIAGLRVKPRGAVIRYGGDDTDPLMAGRQLGVQVVVEGSFRVQGDRLRVRLAAVSVAEGFQLWARRFAGDAGDLFEVAADAADAIADALTVDRAVRPVTLSSDPVVIDLYMRARRQMWAHWNGDVENALESWEIALARAPDDPRVLAGAATYFARLSHLRSRYDIAAEYRRRATEYARRALAGAPKWPEPHVALAVLCWNTGDLGEAMNHLDVAIDVSPGYVDAHTLAGKILLEVGPLEQGIRHLEQALELDPNDYNARWELARGYALRQDFDAADALFALPVDESDQVFARYVRVTRIDLWREAPRWLDDPIPTVPTSQGNLALFGRVAREVATKGDLPPEFEMFMRFAEEWAVIETRIGFIVFQVAAEIACYVGRHEGALDMVERAVEAGLLDIVWVDHCPALDPIRGEPRLVAARETLQERREERMRAANRASIREE